jgi:hypothetical protein
MLPPLKGERRGTEPTNSKRSRFMQLQVDSTNPHFREMVRQQLLGDEEYAREIEVGREGQDPHVLDRLGYVRGLACVLGISLVAGPIIQLLQ